MDLLSVIRRWHFHQGIPIREIKRRTGLSHNTIRKYLRADTVEPVFKVPDRPSKLDPFAEKLTGWLRVEAGKSRKQKRTAKQLHADLVALGYDGSYTRVAAFARDWKRERQYEQQTNGRGTFVPLVFQPGEAFQFDWSEDYAVLGGKPVKLQVAHTKLSHSASFHSCMDNAPSNAGTKHLAHAYRTQLRMRPPHRPALAHHVKQWAHGALSHAITFYIKFHKYH